MNRQRLPERLRDEPLPDEHGAEERAWRVVSEAHAGRPAVQPRGRFRGLPRLATAAACLAALVAFALTPPGEAVGEWIEDTIDVGREPSKPALDSLPAGGRLLVTSPAGAWVVQQDGSERRLGPFGEADWSPRGLYVAVTRGHRLIAVDPQGEVRWSLTRPDLVSHPAWSEEPGYRIAYLSGDDLRVVAGDGTGDRSIAIGVPAVTPAWRPGPLHVLAHATRQGRVVVRDTDARRVLWRSAAGAPPVRLDWTTDGARLVAGGDRSLRVFDRDGAPLLERRLPAGTLPESVELHPDGRSAAFVRRLPDGGNEALTMRLAPGAHPRRLFSGEGRFGDLAWSPDGRWLLLAWRDADQWLFIRSTKVRRITAVSGVSRQFDPAGEGSAAFPQLAGWCCR